ncbi:MAG: hypothetical protein OHK0022_15040 [Roseiflexaceae bacterium]
MNAVSATAVPRFEYVFSGVQVHQQPFLHFRVQQVFDGPVCDRLLRWFETEAPWQVATSHFYQIYRFNMLETPALNSVGCGFAEQTFTQLKGRAEELFGTALEDRVTVIAHKVLPGQKIGIHNDAPQGDAETHRLVVQLNSGWKDENGGYLLFFNSNNPRDIAQIYPPVHNTAVGFELSPHSYHAVSQVEKGTRFSLIYSFWKRHR